jgi:FtsH ternary system domain X5
MSVRLSGSLFSHLSKVKSPMSRAYRISIAESLRRHLTVDDGIVTQLELLPILPKERMAELLAAQLLGEGFERKGKLAVRKEKNGIEVRVDLETGELKVTAEGTKALDLKAERAIVVEEERKVMEEKALRAAAVKQLEREAKHEEELLRREVTTRLEGRLKDLHGELDGVLNRVAAEALKQRAKELGEVLETHEDPSTGNVTIKVRV